MEALADDLVSDVIGGNRDAYAQIVEGYREDVWRIAAYALRDDADTEDLVQQVFVKAYFALGSYERGRDFGAWIRQCARNEVKKELRRRSRESRKLERYGRWMLRCWEDESLAESRERELSDALRRCREDLAEPASRGLALRYEQGLGFDRIARVLDRSVTACRQLLQRTRSSLRECVQRRMGIRWTKDDESKS